MRLPTKLLSILLLSTVMAGCTTTQSPVYKVMGEETRKFNLRIESDPIGAEIFGKEDGEIRLVGKTPIAITFPFEKAPSQGFLGYVGKRIWQPVKSNPNKRFVVRRRDKFVIEIPELTMKKEGYEPENFKIAWEFPIDMRKEFGSGRSVAVETQRKETVVMRKPTKPHFIRKVTIDSLSKPFDIYTIGSDGGLGEKVGSTPLVSRVGFAPERSDSGEIVSWKRWDIDGHQIWKHDSNGVLFMDAYLVRKGYAPEKIAKYPIANKQKSSDTSHLAKFELTKPSEPQARFVLSVDSLPSQAEVYVLRDDGSLGRKLSETPFELEIGFAQQLSRRDGAYVHEDWILWAPEGLLQRNDLSGGATQVLLACSFYKEGFAIENIIQPIFKLIPGKALPSKDTLTIPLLTPEQAAARESSRVTIQKEKARQASPQTEGRRVFIWQSSKEGSESKSEQSKKQSSTGEEKKADKGFFKKIFGLDD